MKSIKELKSQLVSKEHYDYNDLCNLVKVLRSDEGCPWDREQTNKSIRNAFIEETYEFIEGLDLDDNKLMCEELGDVLFQIVFHTNLKSEEGAFCDTDVIDGICKKMILRHPHVFGDVSVSGSAEVLVNWENIKNDEKQRKTPYEQMDSIAKTLPSLIRACKLQSKAEKCELHEKRTKDEYIDEVQSILSSMKNTDDGKDIGKLLFAVCGLSRRFDKNPEELLKYECDNFLKKFEK